MFLGTGGPDVGMPYFLHNSKFKIVERAMISGIRTEVQIVLDALDPDASEPPQMPEGGEKMPPAGTVAQRRNRAGISTPHSHAPEKNPSRLKPGQPTAEAHPKPKQSASESARPTAKYQRLDAEID